ncbi:hypothetical protein Pcinc_003025 [Petrolisthes cinctipes]|uniref:Sec7/BIG1-like C-terminal domain-containing protein n=1 Tax=Petrolisthes cinctipes TaxID=88211 RepID=A0AAE1L512_PETCI|nr:hypothetical protein Pcinc_003025 [Petrolisthes cinctipes]
MCQILFGLRLDCDKWNRWCRCVVECQQTTLPHHLLTWRHPQQQHQQVEMMGGGEWTVPRDLLVKCLVQLNLVQCIQDTLFFPSHTNIENDRENPSLAQTGSRHTPQEDHQKPIMYNNFTTQQIFTLIDCLLEMHGFAKHFNSNHNQRHLLQRAGIRGSLRPNLLQQETCALACALRILFRMLADPSRQHQKTQVEERLLCECRSALQYYSTLPYSHRQAWTNILILILTNFLNMSSKQFSNHARYLYSHFYDVSCFNPQHPGLRSLLRHFFYRREREREGD